MQPALNWTGESVVMVTVCSSLETFFYVSVKSAPVSVFLL